MPMIGHPVTAAWPTPGLDGQRLIADLLELACRWVDRGGICNVELDTDLRRWPVGRPFAVPKHASAA